MPHRTLNLEELADYLHLSTPDVERLLRETDLPRETRGGRMIFRRGAIDEWASQRILGLPDKRLDAYHQKLVRRPSPELPGGALIPVLLEPNAIDLELPSKTAASVVRDMVALADRTGRVLDPRELLESVRAREEMCSTALPGGMALLHARQLAEYRFESSFIALGRSVQEVPFGAPDGRPTQLFFLICCEDERLHLHTLARLCVMGLKTNMIDALLTAESAALAYEELVRIERDVLPPAPATEA